MPVSPHLNNGAGSSIFYVGRKFRNALLTGVIPNGSTLIRGNSVDLSLSQTIDSVEFTEDVGLVEVSAANALMKNYVPTKGDFDATLTEFINSEGFPNVLYAFKNYTYVLIEIAISPTADIAYANNGGPVPYAGIPSDGMVIQCPMAIGSTRYGYSENQEAATVSGKPMGLFIAVCPNGTGLTY